nr:two-component regulator propeller domain-containing protein [Shewanella jiangmenensis]
MNTVNDLLTDKQGYLWVATQAGLNRFDGKKFKVYTQSQAPFGPSANDIAQLHLSAKGELWLLTENAGLNLYHPQDDSFSVFGLDAGVSSAGFSGIAEDGDGNLWLATDSRGIQLFSPHETRVVRELNSQSSPALPSDTLSGIIADGDKGFWINTSLGLYHLSTNGDSKQPLALAGLKVSAMAAAKDGTLWLGSDDMQLYRYSSDIASLELVANFSSAGSEKAPITDLKFDGDGRLWIATAGAGLGLLDPTNGKLRRFEHAPSNYLSLSSQNLTRLWLDDEQQLWIGTRSSGVSHMSLPAWNFRHIHGQSFAKNNLKSTDIRSIYRDRQGQLWIGSTAGLMRADENTRGDITGFLPHGLPFDGLEQSFISFIREDAPGNLWVGTRGQGLIVISPNRDTAEQFKYDPSNQRSLPSNTLYSLFVDSKEHYWVTTLDGGISRVNLAERSFESIGRKGNDLLPEDQVTGLAEGKDGRLWVSTYGGGLAVIDSDGNSRHFNTQSTPALPSNHLFSIHMTDDNVLWVACDNGVFSLEPDTLALRHINREQGLVGDVVYLSVLDNSKHLWAGSASGLAVIDTHTGDIRNFTELDGLQNNEFNFGAAFVDADGSVYLGGINGFNHINPAMLPKRPVPRAPVIDEFLLLNKPAKLPSTLEAKPGEMPSISLRYNESLFTFGFQSPALTDASQLSYQYRLLGLDDNWLNSLGDQKASFTGLSAGHYQFEVRARNLDGQLSPVTSLDIVITPAPWQTWWAYALYLGFILAIAALILFMSLSKYRAKMALMGKIAISEQRLQQALWSSGDEFWDWEIAKKRLTRSNTFLRYPDTEQSLENTLQSVIHPEDLPLVRDVISACLYQGHDEFEVSYRGMVDDESWLWVLNHGKVISRDERGRPNRIMGTIKNIQRLKEAEEALRSLNAELEHRVLERTQELMQKNEQLNNTLEELSQTRDELVDKEKMATLGGLVASITHEVNTPIGISVTAASHLKDRVREFTTAFNKGEVDESDFVQYQSEVNDCCKLMLTNLERAAKLISSFKKVSVDQSHDELREFDLCQYVEEIFLSLNPLLSRSGHRYSYECDPQLYINSNPGIFYQIISNLFNNSIIHAYPDGKEGKLELNIRQTENGIEIDYRDDGCGMNEEIQQHIFHPFYTTKRGKGGSGLGMNIVYNLVHQVLGGDIQLYTAPGEGARFVITLPASILVQKPT